MKGFVSTSLIKKEALKFAFERNEENKKPVLIEIAWPPGVQKQQFKLDSAIFSQYPYEKEVLLIDGIKLLIDEVKTN